MKTTTAGADDFRRISAFQIRTIGLPAMMLIAIILTVMTANECHNGFTGRHIVASYVPSLLFGFVTWFWWVAVVTMLWWCAQKWPALLRISPRIALSHLGMAFVLGISHLMLLQYTVWWSGAHWPVWGNLYGAWHLGTPERLGVDLVIYACIYGFAGFLYAQAQTQRGMIEKLNLERQLSQAQLKALQMQMEPHFLFNTLNAVTSLVAQKRNDEAMDTLEHLNTILRVTLQRKAPEKVPFSEELRVIESYLAIQKVRFSDRLEVKIDTTSEALDGLVPCFLLQPLVENAIQHGIAPSATGGRIETSVRRIGDQLWMQVRDNGCGPNGQASSGHGIGMQNIRERLAYFYPGAHDFNAVAPASGGYEVTIQIPYERAFT